MPNLQPVVPNPRGLRALVNPTLHKNIFDRKRVCGHEQPFFDPAVRKVRDDFG